MFLEVGRTNERRMNKEQKNDSRMTARKWKQSRMTTE
jgi:hypothetical protein